jgi:hypothetical protein
MNEQIGVTYFPVLGGAGYHMAVCRKGRTSVGPTEALIAHLRLRYLEQHIATPEANMKDVW